MSIIPSLPASSRSPLPSRLSELILPKQPTLSQTLTSLKKSRLSIHNRLVSIQEDSDFAVSIASANSLPLVPNERCGSWYVPPDLKKGSVYFKSTDGHQGQWSFSLRRLNLGLLELLGNHGGAVIVDSTRRGKSMPDALSKTVPIWVDVWNRVLFSRNGWCHGLVTPEEVVARSEHAQIEQRIDGFVEDLLALKLDLDRLRDVLKKPIRVAFISRQSPIIVVEQNQDYHTLICCSASRHENGDGDIYVQGAGDDTENWAHGLTAELFWTYKHELLLEKNEERLKNLIEELQEIKAVSIMAPATRIRLQDIATDVYVQASTICASNLSCYGAVISCTDTILSAGSTLPGIPILSLRCQSGKLGGKSLRDKLPQVDVFVGRMLQVQNSTRLLVLCSTGKDLSIGVALAILCRYVNGQGQLQSQPKLDIGKNFVKQQLAYILASVPEAKPSRATLQSVNAYLMGHLI